MRKEFIHCDRCGKLLKINDMFKADLFELCFNCLKIYQDFRDEQKERKDKFFEDWARNQK